MNWRSDAASAGMYDPDEIRPTTLGERLSAARQERFVGRTKERNLFRKALAAEESPFAVLYIHGSGGTGKTALLRAFADDALAAGAEARYVDARSIAPLPQAFLAALGVNTTGGDAATPLLSLGPNRPVVMIDGYEVLEPLDGWLREQFLVLLPAQTLVVISGRNPPAPDWYTDPGWTDLLHVVELSNLSAGEASAYLDASGVPPANRDTLLTSTQGHPLALFLAVEGLVQAEPAGDPLSASSVPDVVRQLLLDRLVERLPSLHHRLVLETCALARVTTHQQIRAVTGRSNVDELFDWLRSQPFIVQDQEGLSPHELVRDILTNDLRWRDPQRFRELMQILLQSSGEELFAEGNGTVSRRALIDLIYTLRAHADIRGFFDFQHLVTLRSETVTTDDRASTVNLVEQQAGSAIAAIAGQWFDRQCDAFRVTRDASGGIESVVCQLLLDDASAGCLGFDPVAQAIWKYVDQQSPPDTTRTCTVLRFGYPDRRTLNRRRMTNLASYECLRRTLCQPRSSWDFLVARSLEWWGPLVAFAGYERVWEADVHVDGYPQCVFGHDWTSIPRAWSRIIVDQEWREAGRRQLEPTPPPDLAREGFSSAVRRALRDLHRPDALARNPLIKSRMVLDSASDRVPSEALSDLLASSIHAFFQNPRDEKLRRVLRQTYLRPAPTQEKAAELLGLPFSTYRRHLARAVERVISGLWEREQTHRGSSTSEAPNK